MKQIENLKFKIASYQFVKCIVYSTCWGVTQKYKFQIFKFKSSHVNYITAKMIDSK